MKELSDELIAILTSVILKLEGTRRKFVNTLWKKKKFRRLNINNMQNQDGWITRCDKS